MDFWEYILAGVDNNSDMPAIFLGIVVAYFTILISVAIAIFSEKKEFEALDRNVILDHIIKAKYLLIYLGLTSIPFLFWNGSPLWARLIEIFLWILGIFFITRILFKAYHWMKGNKFQLRFNYLRDLNDKQDTEEAWRSVWKTENINSQNEQEFFRIFKSSVNRMLKKKNLIIASKLIEDFNNFFDKRDYALFSWSPEALESVLEWHFEMWKKYQLKLIDRSDEWMRYGNLSRTIDSIFQKIEKQELKGSLPAYSFFESFEKHTDKYKMEKVSSKTYLSFLFKSFYNIFFQNIYDAPESFDIWEQYFPKKWKITKNNLEDTEDHNISKLSLNNYLNWAVNEIRITSEEKNFPLDDITRNLFPEVDPFLWARILIFCFSPYGESRIRSVIERPWNFGFISRIKTSESSEETSVGDLFKEDEQKTFELTYYLFRDHFSDKKLNSYMIEIEMLSFPQNSAEESKRLRLKQLFAMMLEFVKGANLINS